MWNAHKGFHFFRKSYILQLRVIDTKTVQYLMEPIVESLDHRKIGRIHIQEQNNVTNFTPK